MASCPPHAHGPPEYREAMPPNPRFIRDRHARKQTVQHRTGFASLMAMFLMMIFVALGVAYASMANNSILQSGNQLHAQNALLQAESGQSFFLNQLSGVTVPSGTTGTPLLTSLYGSLGGLLNGTANLNGQSVSFDGNVITIPPIATDSVGRSFSIAVTLAGNNAIHISVTGSDGNLGRGVCLDCNLVPGASGVFNYGIASKSAIDITGNASILGKNNPHEADILSTTYTMLDAIDLTGNCTIAGDVSISDPNGYLSRTGNVSIGGQSSSSGIAQHVHIGADDPSFPEMDTTQFASLATNVIDSSTNYASNLTLNNIYIKANTNPNFSGNDFINGIVYIESPNKVSFTGNATITGMIVTEDAGDNAYNNNTIAFTGNVVSRGVDSLPSGDANYATLKTMPGSFLLAPGFGVSFTGNFGIVNGAMGADQFSFTGNAGGTIHGPMINYGNSHFTLTGNSSITIDRSGGTTAPPGFVLPQRFATIPDTYLEK